MDEIYMVRGRGNKFKQLIAIKTALLLGYKVNILTPSDKCYGNKVNFIINEFPLDKPLK